MHELSNAAQGAKTELLVNGFGQQVAFERIGQAYGIRCLHDDFLFGLGITLLLGITRIITNNIEGKP